MPIYHFKIIGLSLLFYSIAIVSNEEHNFLSSAKQSLVEREREYLKSRPMSQDLKTFIDKCRRKKSLEKRKKRSQNDNMLYMLKDGQLVPLDNAIKSDENEMKAPETGYHVVPLIIPEPKLIKTRTAEVVKEKAVNATEATTTCETPNGEKSDNSTEEETKVLHKILEDVEGLMAWKHEGNKKEGFLCDLNGSWISEAAGMRFDISYQNSTRKKFRIHVADRIPPTEEGFLCDGNWTLFGELPFLHSGMVIVLAVHGKDKHIATFIGECRTCEGSETVTGTWLIGRSSRDCKDQKAAHKILSDVWRREQAHNLRKKHLQQLGYKIDDQD